MRDGESSIYSDVSVTTIRTRHDENGQRHGSEDARYSNSTTQEIEELESLNCHRGDKELGGYEEPAQTAVTPQESSGFEHIELQPPAKEGGGNIAWWTRS